MTRKNRRTRNKSTRRSFRKVRRSVRKDRRSSRKVRRSTRKVRRSSRKVRRSVRKDRRSSRKDRRSSRKDRRSSRKRRTLKKLRRRVGGSAGGTMLENAPANPKPEEQGDAYSGAGSEIQILQLEDAPRWWESYLEDAYERKNKLNKAPEKFKEDLRKLFRGLNIFCKEWDQKLRSASPISENKCIMVKDGPQTGWSPHDKKPWISPTGLAKIIYGKKTPILVKKVLQDVLGAGANVSDGWQDADTGLREEAERLNKGHLTMKEKGLEGHLGEEALNIGAHISEKVLTEDVFVNYVVKITKDQEQQLDAEQLDAEQLDAEVDAAVKEDGDVANAGEGQVTYTFTVKGSGETAEVLKEDIKKYPVAVASAMLKNNIKIYNDDIDYVTNVKVDGEGFFSIKEGDGEDVEKEETAAPPASPQSLAIVPVKGQQPPVEEEGPQEQPLVEEVEDVLSQGEVERAKEEETAAPPASPQSLAIVPVKGQQPPVEEEGPQEQPLVEEVEDVLSQGEVERAKEEETAAPPASPQSLAIVPVKGQQPPVEEEGPQEQPPVEEVEDVLSRREVARAEEVDSNIQDGGAGDSEVSIEIEIEYLNRNPDGKVPDVSDEFFSARPGLEVLDPGNVKFTPMEKDKVAKVKNAVLAWTKGDEAQQSSIYQEQKAVEEEEKTKQLEKEAAEKLAATKKGNEGIQSVDSDEGKSASSDASSGVSSIRSDNASSDASSIRTDDDVSTGSDDSSDKGDDLLIDILTEVKKLSKECGYYSKYPDMSSYLALLNQAVNDDDVNKYNRIINEIRQHLNDKFPNIDLDGLKIIEENEEREYDMEQQNTENNNFISEILDSHSSD